LKENAELAAYDPFEMKDGPAAQPGLADAEKEALDKVIFYSYKIFRIAVILNLT